MSQIAPTREKGTARKTIAVLINDFVFRKMITKMMTKVSGMTYMRRLLARCMYSYWPLHAMV